MVGQNASCVLVRKYSRQQQGHSRHYNVAIVVVLQELFKLVFCAVVLAVQARSFQCVLTSLTQPRELFRIAIPAACFTLQNNVLYVALSNLEPLLFQITYQMKTLLTALLSVLLVSLMLLAMTYANGFDEFFEPFAWSAMLNGMI